MKRQPPRGRFAIFAFLRACKAYERLASKAAHLEHHIFQRGQFATLRLMKVGSREIPQRSTLMLRPENIEQSLMLGCRWTENKTHTSA